MLPLKIMQEKHPSASYLTKDKKRIRDIVVADKKKGDVFWYDYSKKDEYKLEFIPKNLVAEINDLSRPFITDTRPQAYRDNIARTKVFPALVESVIESMPTPHETDDSKIVFKDYLVLVPLNPIYAELKVYVPSDKAGMLRIPRTSEFGADAFVEVKRIKHGEVTNEYTLFVNGTPVLSNEVKTYSFPDPEPKKPQPKNELPNTGEASSMLGVAGLIMSLATAGFVVTMKRKEI